MKWLICLFICLINISIAAVIDQAELYNRHSSLQWQWAISALAHHPLPEQAKVLDVGCGDGKVTAALSEILPEGWVIGLDLSPKMVSFASKTFSSQNLVFLQGDIRALPFENQFDWIVSFCTQHWILEQETALTSMRNALATGGKVLIVTLGPSPYNLGPRCEELVRSEKWSSYFPDFKPQRLYLSASEYRALLQKVGFTEIVIEETPSVTTFSSPENFRQWLQPLVSCSSHLPPQLQEEFLSDLFSLMLPAGFEDTVTIHDLKLEIVAQKDG